jgi:glucose/arabinose dehydrogenase
MLKHECRMTKPKKRLLVAKDGSLLFSEDGNKTIWRVSYGGK